MKTEIKNQTRHFPYKHPTFGTKNKRKPEIAWKKTVYYWWWAYLKRNTEYLECCENNGEGKLASLYADFGDVRGDDFRDWWTKDSRGFRLFAEPRTEDTIRLLEDGEEARDGVEMMTVSVPLYLPKRFLTKRFSELLSKKHTGKRGKQYAKKSNATYRFQGQPNIPALEQGLMVYDAIKEAEALGIKKAYWEIAMDLKILTSDNRIRSTDPKAIQTAKKNIATAIVGRYKKRVDASIKLTSQGFFPKPKKSIF